jgi:hypothetical protein
VTLHILDGAGLVQYNTLFKRIVFVESAWQSLFSQCKIDKPHQSKNILEHDVGSSRLEVTTIRVVIAMRFKISTRGLKRGQIQMQRNRFFQSEQVIKSMVCRKLLQRISMAL